MCFEFKCNWLVMILIVAIYCAPLRSVTMTHNDDANGKFRQKTMEPFRNGHFKKTFSNRKIKFVL